MQNRNIFSKLPDAVMHHMMTFEHPNDKLSYAYTSKQAVKVTSKNPHHQKTIKIDDFVFNELFYQELIPSYITIEMSGTKKAEIKTVAIKKELYKHHDLICKMMEDKGFRELIRRFHPDDTKKSAPSIARRIAQGALGGILALITSAITICLLYPFALLGAIFCCWRSIRFLGVIFSPLCIFYSTVRSAYLNAHPSCRTVKIKDILLSSIAGSVDILLQCLFAREKMMNTSAGVYFVDAPFENPWDKYKLQIEALYNNKKTLHDIASDWRKKHPKPACMLPVPPESKSVLSWISSHLKLNNIMMNSSPQKTLLSYATEDQTSYGSVYSAARANDLDKYPESPAMQLGLY